MLNALLKFGPCCNVPWQEGPGRTKPPNKNMNVTPKEIVPKATGNKPETAPDVDDGQGGANVEMPWLPLVWAMWSGKLL